MNMSKHETVLQYIKILIGIITLTIILSKIDVINFILK